jgi:DDE superfamily endonuclease
MRAVAVVSSMAVLPGAEERLAGFRAGWYGCLGRWADALFELTDAVLCAAGPVTSLPRLSLEAVCRRGHGSGYAALARGGADAGALEDLLACFGPAGWPLVFAVDATTWPRVAAETSPGRGFYCHPSRQTAGKPVVAGWCYQMVSQLSSGRDSWTWPVSCQRIEPGADVAAATVAQVAAAAARVAPGGRVPLFAFDAGPGYDPAAISHGLAAVRAQVLIRLRKNRVLFGDPPARVPHAPGRPRRHGPAFACQDESTWGTPDERLVTAGPVYGTVTVRGWAGLHPRTRRRGRWAGPSPAPVVRGWVIRVEVTATPRPASKAGKMLWLWWSGPPGTTPDLDLCWRAYTHRFGIEHAIRFAKTTLGWVTPALRHPQQADRWTAIILAAAAQLVLARPLAAGHRLPWERPRDPALLTPGRVRRDFPRLRATLPPVAKAPKPSRPGPGRPKGRPARRARRYPVIKKAP